MAAYLSSQHEALASELEAVRERRGELTPRAVLDDVKAAGRRHPLYDRFEWDNKVAGEAHRLDQAHRLIMTVRVRFRDSNDEERKVRKYVAVPRPMAYQPDYQDVEAVAMDPLKRRIVLQQAERQWKALRAQYGHLQEFMSMVQADLHDAAS